MTGPQPEPQVALSIPKDDLILPFQAEHAEVAGRLAKLGPVVDTILSRHDYSEPVSKLLGEAVALTPGDRMLVETDAPYLTPEPHRAQKTNEPAMVVHVAATVARVKGMTVADVDRVTTQNAERFFGWEG